PTRCRERIGVWIQLPTRIVLIQRVLGCIPVDVAVRIESQTSRCTREGLYPIEIRPFQRTVYVVDRGHIRIRSAISPADGIDGRYQRHQLTVSIRDPSNTGDAVGRQ